MTGLRPKQNEDFLDRGMRFCCFMLSGHCDERVQHCRVREIRNDPPRNRFHWCDNIGHPGVDRTARHAVELRGRGILHKGDARVLLDRLEPECPVAAHPGENDRDAALLRILRERTKEEIDGKAESARCNRIEQVQPTIHERDILAGRNHVHLIRLDAHAIDNLRHRHRCYALQQLGEHALIGRIEMLYNDKRHSARRGHISQEYLKRFEAAG